jgi:hypothetical protein
MSSTPGSLRSSDSPIRHAKLSDLLNMSAFHVACSTGHAKVSPNIVFLFRECIPSVADLYFLIYFVNSSVNKRSAVRNL